MNKRLNGIDDKDAGAQSVGNCPRLCLLDK
jgi:hypothetical protein